MTLDVAIAIEEPAKFFAYIQLTEYQNKHILKGDYVYFDLFLGNSKSFPDLSRPIFDKTIAFNYV